MAKEKKIGIKYYLNDKLKPTIKKDSILFPLYIRITYNGEVTRIKVNDSLGDPILLEYGASDETIDKYIELSNKNQGYSQIYLNRDLIKEIIRLEIKANGENFYLSGLTDRLSFYDDVLFQRIIDKYNELEIFLRDYLTYNQYELIGTIYTSPTSLYYYAKSKINNIEDILPKKIKQTLIALTLLHFFDNEFTLYDWVGTSKKNKFISFLDALSIEKLGAEKLEDKSLKETLNNLSFLSSQKDMYIIAIEDVVKEDFS